MGIPDDLKAVLFDMDGTLIDLRVDFPALRQQLSEMVGQPVASITELLRTPAGDDPQVQELIEQAEVEAAAESPALPGAAEVIRNLSQKYKLAVVSRNTRAGITKALAQFPEDILVISRDEVDNVKPHPEALELALQKLGISADHAVMVGDTFHDVEAAKSAGMCSVVVKNPKLHIAPEGADYYIDSMNELEDLLAQR